MKIHKVLGALEPLALIVGLVSLGGVVEAASPLLVVGPQAIQANVVSPSYGLFTCQVVGRSPGETCYDPYQIRHAYGVDTLINAGFTGKGKTIVIIDAFQNPNLIQQLNVQDGFYGLPGLNGLGAPTDPNLGTFTQVAPDGLTPFVPSDPNMSSWAQEISLDVMWAHAIAPGANITLVLAKSNEDVDILSATKYAIDNNLGDIISQSFGENESCVDPNLLAQQHQLFVEATMRNITIFASTGDSGAGQGSCDGNSLVQAASSPAVDPLVTAVGGTELQAARYCLASLGCNPAANPTPGTYEGEIVWNEPAFGASGGGFSVLFDEPSYQEGTIKGGKQRGVPDVAYDAAVLQGGVLTYLDIPGVPSGFYLFGGTSAGSPQWSAILAIAGQEAGHDLGFINTALYHIGQAPPHYAASFNDVTNGNNAFGGVAGFAAGSGWDPTTGLGSPMASQLVNYLIQFVSPGDGTAAIAGSMPHSNGYPSAPGHKKPH
jgi:subtilase family serine protease